MAQVEFVVLLGSAWGLLADRTTRWRELAVRLVDDPRVARLTVVDFVRFRPRALRPLVEPVDSWLPGVRCLRVDVPLHRAVRSPLDAVVWRAAARRLDDALERPAAPRLVLCANPLAVPLALRLPAAAHGFDAYDDWRALPSLAASRRRVGRGYARAVGFDTVTFGSPALREVLGRDAGLAGAVVRNGVDAARFAAGGPAPAGLPAGAFAVYVGTVQERVDLDLLAATVAELPVVVAGSIGSGERGRLEAAGVRCLGHVPADLLPGLLAAAAVGLVPHRQDALTASMDPLKILEYRAAGLPVVATDVPGADLDGVIVVRDAADWLPAVAVARRAARSPATGLRSWSEVVDELLDRHGVGRPALAAAS